jgi:membrane fusion protein
MATTTMHRRLFRERAVRASARRWFAPVQVACPLAAMPACVIAILAVALLAAATVIIEIPETIPATGVLLPSRGLLKIRAGRSGWVGSIDIEDGERVGRDRVLMRITDAQRAPERHPEAAARLASLHTELALLGTSLDQQLAAIDEAMRAGQRRKTLVRRRLEAARSEHTMWQRQAELQQRKASRVAALAADGVVPAQNSDDLAAEVLRARASAEAARQRVLTLEDELAGLDEEFSRDATRPALLRAQVAIRRESLLREIASEELRSASEVTAPGDGIVAGITVRDGSFVQAGQVLLTLYDPGDPLQARLYVSADNAAMIFEGQHAELRLRAYPKELFGTLAATVTSIAATALPPAEAGAGLPLTGKVFEIRAAIDSPVIVAEGRRWLLAPGTTFEADLVRRRWPLYRWLLASRRTDGGRAT